LEEVNECCRKRFKRPESAELVEVCTGIQSQDKWNDLAMAAKTLGD